MHMYKICLLDEFKYSFIQWYVTYYRDSANLRLNKQKHELKYADSA
jgi:hypothetical protein